LAAAVSSGQPLQAGEEALRGRRRGGLGENALQTALRIGFGLAFRAGRQVRENALARVMTELTVHQGGEPVAEVLLDGRQV
jgi:hypothetical protein